MQTKQGINKTCRRPSRQKCAKTNQNTKVQDRWFYETVPAMTVPALTVSALAVPALTVPALTVPAMTVPAMTKPYDEDLKLYYPPWSIHLHPGMWEYYRLESTQEKLRHRAGMY